MNISYLRLTTYDMLILMKLICTVYEVIIVFVLKINCNSIVYYKITKKISEISQLSEVSPATLGFE